MVGRLRIKRNACGEGDRIRKRRTRELSADGAIRGGPSGQVLKGGIKSLGRQRWHAHSLRPTGDAGELPDRISGIRGRNAGGAVATTKEAVIIEGAPGTEPYEMTIRILFYDKQVFTLDSLSTEIKAGLAKLPGAEVSTAPVRTTEEGRSARVQAADYTSRDSTGRERPFKQLTAIVEYRDHLEWQDATVGILKRARRCQRMTKSLVIL